MTASTPTKLIWALCGFCLFYFPVTQIAAACELPERWLRMKNTEPGQDSVRAALNTVPQKIEVGEPFSVDIALCGQETESIDRITIDASMPAHKHGMNYKPVVKKLNNNRFQGQGMLFHMPGIWQIDFAAYYGNKLTRMTIDIEVE